MEIEAPPLRPVLKWAGGKRQLLARIAPLVPEDPALYVEPFVGAGAVLLACQPARARVNDLNAELVGVWLAVRDEPQALLACLREHARLDSEAHYYEVRALDRGPGLARLTPAERAARAVYLNKTCFNGLWRVNSRGQFNVPYGRYPRPDIVNEAGVMALSAYLRKNRVEVTCGDYAAALRGLPAGAFAYLDPPLRPRRRDVVHRVHPGRLRVG